MAATPPNSASVRRRRLKEDYVSIYERFLKETIEHAEKIKGINPEQRNLRQKFYHQEYPAFYKRIQKSEKYIKLLLGAAEIDAMYESCLKGAAVYSSLLELKMSIIELKINSIASSAEKGNGAEIKKLKADYNKLKKYGEHYTEFFKNIEECKEEIKGLNEKYSEHKEYCKRYIQLLGSIEKYKKKIMELNKEDGSHRKYDKELADFFKNSIEENRKKIKELNEDNSGYYSRCSEFLDNTEDNNEKIKWLKDECTRYHEAYYEAHKSPLSSIIQNKKVISELYSAVPSRLKDSMGLMLDSDDSPSQPWIKLSDGLDRLNETYYQQGYDEARHLLRDLIFIYHPDAPNAPSASPSTPNSPPVETGRRKISFLSLPKAAESPLKNEPEEANGLLRLSKQQQEVEVLSMATSLNSPFIFFPTGSSSDNEKKVDKESPKVQGSPESSNSECRIC
ncbi:MAG: hypothetical protein K0R48_163 [Gammaproteobacteria bacterium]|jgi:hypothetical protein|nr:hypothetical protein [Gammaproteobacteria bacterium]